MVDTGLITAIVSTVGVTSMVSWKVFSVLNAKTNVETTDRIFELVDADRKDIAAIDKTVALMGKDVQRLTVSVDGVGRNVEAILKNGKTGGRK
jgi:Tfp pilus assembly ATPase PilU